MKTCINLACSYKFNLNGLKTLLLLFSASLSVNIAAQGLPDVCVKLPQRTAACPNIIYKRSPINVPITNTKKGEMVCICLADFTTLRIEAETEPAKQQQMAELKRMSSAVGIPERDLITLIRN